MAPTALVDTLEAISSLAKRQSYRCDIYGNCYNYGNSNWYNWGRWVALAAIVVFVVLVALMFSCFNARRRRRRGVQPMYGTGWLAGKTPDGHNGPSYTGYNNQYQNPAPPYSQQPVNNQYTGQTYNSNEGYYGQQNGIELQQPQQTYGGYGGQRGGDPVYDAPNGPPPKK